MQNIDAAGALAKANVGEQLTERERVLLQFFSDELFIASAVSHGFSEHSGTFYHDDAYAIYLVDILRRNPGLLPEWDRLQDIVDLVAPEYWAHVDAAVAELRPSAVAADS